MIVWYLNLISERIVRICMAFCYDASLTFHIIPFPALSLSSRSLSHTHTETLLFHAVSHCRSPFVTLFNTHNYSNCLGVLINLVMKSSRYDCRHLLALNVFKFRHLKLPNQNKPKHTLFDNWKKEKWKEKSWFKYLLN